MFNNWQELEEYIRNIEFDKDINSYKSKLLNIPDFNHYFLLRSQFIYIVDLTEFSITFMSPNVESIIGYKESELDLNTILDLIHPEDKQEILKRILNGFEFFFESNTTKTGDEIFSLEFRIRTKNNNYINISRQSLVMTVDRKGNPVHIFHIITDISHLNHTNELCKLVHLKTKSDKMGLLLSKRELEIVQLVALGKTSKMIADELFISVHTVEKHRKNILKRHNLKNFIELINKAKEQNLF